jgi:hypothetical protein
MDKKAAAQAVLADPEFDVEGFVKNINIHYQNKQIARMLGSHASIFLSLIEDGEYKFLEIMSEFIDEDVFKQLSDQGYEMWTRIKKTTSNWRRDSRWIGLVINPELAIHYRALGHSHRDQTTFEVVSGKSAADKMRKKWKRLRMYPNGKQPTEVKPQHPVFVIRQRLWDFGKANLGLDINQRYRSRSKSHMYWSNYKGWKSTNNSSLSFDVLQSGPNNVRIRVREDGVYKGIKIPNDDPNLCLKAFSWASQATKDNQKFRDAKLEPKIGLLEAAEGIK